MFKHEYPKKLFLSDDPVGSPNPGGNKMVCFQVENKPATVNNGGLCCHAVSNTDVSVLLQTKMAWTTIKNLRCFNFGGREICYFGPLCLLCKLGLQYP